MAYQKIVFTDQLDTGNKYNITNNPDNTKAIEYAGEITHQGTPLSAENMNHMEQGIYNAAETADQAANDINNLKTGKANKSDVYTKSETDSKLSNKVDKISGMGLSQESYTTAEKSKLAELSNYDDTVVKKDIADLKSKRINGVLFDGSGDIKIRLDTYVVSDSLSTWSATPWHKIASCEMTSRVTTRALTLYVERTLHPRPGGSGILRAIIRSGDTASVLGHAHLNWEYANSEINPDNFVLVYNSDETSGKLTAELWAKINSQYETWQFKVLSMGETTVADIPVWTMYNLGSGAENYPESTGVITSSFMGIKNNADTASTVSAIQKSLYSTTSGGNIASPLSVTVTDLFAKYSLIICNMTTSAGQISCMLPMKYIKSKPDEYYIASNYALLKYVDDSTMTIHTGLGQSNPTISKVELIAVY